MKKLILSVIMIFAMALISNAALAAMVNEDNNNPAMINKGNNNPATDNNAPASSNEGNNDPATTNQNQASSKNSNTKHEKSSVKVKPPKGVKEMVN